MISYLLFGGLAAFVTRGHGNVSGHDDDVHQHHHPHRRDDYIDDVHHGGRLRDDFSDEEVENQRRIVQKDFYSRTHALTANDGFFSSVVNKLENVTGIDIDGDGDVGIEGSGSGSPAPCTGESLKNVQDMEAALDDMTRLFVQRMRR